MPKINQEEYEVLKELDDKWKWIARDEDGELYVYTTTPHKGAIYWINEDPMFGGIDDNIFQFIQWEDEEPHNIAELIEEYESQFIETYNAQKELEELDRLEESEETEVKKDLKEAILGIEVTQFDGQKADLEELVHPKQLENVISDWMPEVLSDEWIDENKKDSYVHYIGYYVPIGRLRDLLVPKQEITFEQAHDKLRGESTLSEKSFDYYWNCISDNVEIDEPGNPLVPEQELPVIPKFVADWIENIETKGVSSLYGTLRSLNAKLVSDSKWIEWNEETFENYGHNDPQELIARAWLDGYEVEEEQKYYVINEENELILGWSQSAYMTPCIEGYEYMKHNGRENLFQLTEQEIKDYDSRYWPFAAKVEELEE